MPSPEEPTPMPKMYVSLVVSLVIFAKQQEKEKMEKEKEQPHQRPSMNE